MGWIQRFLEKRAKRAIRKLPKIERGVVRFQQRYPGYSIGRGSYGLPEVHDWQEGSTLSIGAYCSIAEGVQIFLGPPPSGLGHHLSLPGHAASGRAHQWLRRDQWRRPGGQ